MFKRNLLFSATLVVLILSLAVIGSAQADLSLVSAEGPVAVTTCGQRPGISWPNLF